MATHPLPTAFLVLAEAALTASGHDSGVPRRLQHAAALLAPVLTARNMIERTQDVCGVALTYAESRARAAGDTTGHAIDAVEIGLVAGYLIGQMMAGMDGVQ